uniref:Uncharacterized protein n=1 Tax=viral metagenome TaxID=1070528 RepID=A0A6M3K6Y1_9ZZZZ
MENTQLVNGSWIIAGSMKASGDSIESKNFRLKVRFSDVPVQDVVAKALEPIKIQWVNGQGRKNFDTWTENQIVEIDFRAPARAPQVDPEVAVAAILSKMSKEEQEAYIAKLLGQAKTVK